MRPTRISLTDGPKQEQPQGTYPYGKNGVRLTDRDINENGFLPSNAQLPYKLIGKIETDTYPILYSTDNVNSAFGFMDVDNDVYIPIFDDAALEFKLNFNTDRPIKGEYRRNFRNEIEVSWLELGIGGNPPRWANTARLGSDLNDYLLFPKSLIPYIDTTIQPGGNLGMGAYYFAARYIKADGTETRYTTLTRPLIAVSDDYSTIPGTNTGKAIAINISGIDQTYDRIGLVVVERINGVDIPYELPELPIAPVVSFIYTGAEKGTQLTIEEVIIPAAFYDNAQAITQLNDQLYLGNMTEEEIIDFQQYANLVNIRWRSELTNVGNRPNLATESGKQRGFMHQEVYAFYIVLKLRNGRNSRAFTIPGPAPLSSDLIASTLAAGQSITAKVYQVEDTCRNVQPDLTGDCGIWLNTDELYPDIAQFDSTSIGGENLRNQPVRHHRMPSIRFCKENLYGSNGDYGRASLDTLGLSVTNVIIPAGLQDQVIGWEIHYAKRDYNNASVMGQSLMMFGAQANEDAGNQVNITSTGGNWGSYQRTHGDGGTGDGESLRILPNYFRFHAFDMLLNRPSISPSFIDLQLTLIARYNDNCVAVNNANEVIYIIDYSNGGANIDPVSVPIPSNRFYRVSDGQYITTNSNSGAFSNIRLEDAYVARIPQAGPNLMNNFGWSWLRRDYDVGNNTHFTFELTYLANLMTIRRNVYLSYFSQDLVRTGQVFPSTLQASNAIIYGGDTFVSETNFNTYGLVTKKDVVTDTGIRDWKTGDTDGIKAVHQFICETVSDVAGRYEIPGNSYSRFSPKSTLSNGTNTFLYSFSRNVNPNQIGYTRDCNAVGDLLNGITIASPYDQFVQVSPNKIVQSEKQIGSSQINSWKNFSALNYYETVKNKGPIINLCGMNDRLIIHTRDALFLTRSKATIETDITQITLGTGDIFQFDPNEVRPAHLGYGGTSNPLACQLTPIGYLYPDNKTGELFLFDGNNLTNIGQGLLNFLLKYLTIKEINNYIGNGIIIGYEQFYKRILLTVKNIGLSSNTYVFVPNYQPTAEFFAILTANESVVYKDGRYQLFKGENSSEYACNTEQYPVLGDYNFTANEHIANGSVIGTIAAAGGTLPYSYLFTTGNTRGLGIDPLTGIITVVDTAEFDYSFSILHLNTIVIDNNGNSDTGVVNVTINHVDSVPVLPAYTVNIPSNSPNNTVVNTEVATDRDGKAITYSIRSGNTGSAFSINSSTGVVKVADATQLDYNTQVTYVLVIRATASNGSYVENTLTINLTFIPGSPSATSSVFNIKDTTANGVIVGTIVPATNAPGQPGDLIYELVTDSTVAGAFVAILDETDTDYLKIKVLDNTKLDPVSNNYVLTLKVYNPSFPDNVTNFTETITVFYDPALLSAEPYEYTCIYM